MIALASELALSISLQRQTLLLYARVQVLCADAAMRYLPRPSLVCAAFWYPLGGMPNRVLCPHCRKTGLVRRERIVKGSTSHVAYFCGACQHTWDLADVQRDTDAKRQAPSKSREKTEKNAAKPKTG